MSIVFVYGSLKRGFANHGILAAHDPQFVGEGKTDRGFALFGTPSGAYPVVVGPDAGFPVTRVKGEVWEVSEKCLLRLDRLEGHPNFYKRETVAIALQWDTVIAWIYVYQFEVTNLFHAVPSGEWKEERRWRG